jgi:hypothetical protein
MGQLTLWLCIHKFTFHSKQVEELLNLLQTKGSVYHYLDETRPEKPLKSSGFRFYYKGKAYPFPYKEDKLNFVTICKQAIQGATTEFQIGLRVAGTVRRKFNEAKGSETASGSTTAG